MKTIEVKRIFHKGNNCLGLFFPFDHALQDIVRPLPGARWSKTNKCWLVDESKGMLFEIMRIFKDVAWINYEELKEKKSGELKLIAPKAEKAELSEEVNGKILKFKYWMRSRRYAEGTIETYTDALKTFFRFFSEKSLQKINNQDIVRFNNEYVLRNNYSAAFQSQVVNAVKLFYSQIQEKDLLIEKIDRPHKPYQLPNVLSVDEVNRIMNSLSNLKHRCMIGLIYSAGLRRSELVNMEAKDIDSKRMLIKIRGGKGKKDRYVPLSPKILEMLRGYYKEYKPKRFLFEGQDGNEYSDRSLGLVLKKGLRLAGIKKETTLHTLRHSYATHLLESGTDLRYIQELLGHNSPKTTMIYTHVSTQQIGKIKSPFDSLNLNEKTNKQPKI